MSIEIISIGDELLCGMTINSNAVFLSQELFAQGYRVGRHTTLSDECIGLQKGLKEVFERSSVVIVTGGLGPTCDDRTRDIVATLFSSTLKYDERVASDLIRRFGSNLISLQDQATIPHNAQPILNRLGTAPGLIFVQQGRTWILLPGVPQEMKDMWSYAVLPFFKKTVSVFEPFQVRQLYLSVVNENQVDPVLRQLVQKYTQVDVGIYPGYGTLKVVMRSDDLEQLQHFYTTLSTAFAPYQYHAPDGRIEEAIHKWFIQEKKTLALAESCTGGMMAAHLTSLPGASAYFLGSFVTYANAMKTSVLEVQSDVLDRYGAVSHQVVAAMLTGVFQHTNADFAIAVSGIAGPEGGSADKPVGTICAAIGQRGSVPDIGTFRSLGNRETVILSTTNRLFGALYRKITQGILAFS